MSSSRSTFARSYAGFVGLALVPAGIIAALGCIVVLRVSPDAGVRSVITGCAISWIASCTGAVPIALAVAARSRHAANSILGATAIRFLVVLVLVVPAVFSGWFDRTVLVTSVAISYVLMLAVDTVLATRAIRQISESRI